MRAFVAVEIDEECRSALLGAVDALKRAADGVRWVRPEQMHVTLKFIGEIDDLDVADAIGCIRPAAERAEPFTMHLAGLSAFPPRGKPRVIHVEAEDASGKLHELHDNVEDALARELGVERENRRYIPHITLGRVKNRGACPPMEEISAALPEQDFGRVDVDSFVLMQSDLQPIGAVYTVVHRFELD
ncbi:MAG: RNA 2',3'-cyclic phosphodiesterase [Planctomycetota bacterium]